MWCAWCFEWSGVNKKMWMSLQNFVVTFCCIVYVKTEKRKQLDITKCAALSALKGGLWTYAKITNNYTIREIFSPFYMICGEYFEKHSDWVTLPSWKWSQLLLMKLRISSSSKYFFLLCTPRLYKARWTTSTLPRKITVN